MKIRWNWGTGIFLTIVAMLSFLAFMVNKTFDYTVNVVSDDYYENGLNHTKQMKKVENSIEFHDGLNVIHTDVCTVQFPEFFNGKTIDGEILFFRPSDFTQDTSFSIQLDSNARQKFSLDPFLKGKYIVKASFNCDDTDYYLEKDIVF
jgi:hypothetical protein